MATIYATTNMEKFITNSTLVVKAKVLSTESKWDQTHTKIFTYATISILDVLKGENAPTELTIEQIGGTVGDESLVIETNPRFTVVEEAILFLVFHENSGGWIQLDEQIWYFNNGTEVAVNPNVPLKLSKLTDKSYTFIIIYFNQ